MDGHIRICLDARSSSAAWNTVYVSYENVYCGLCRVCFEFRVSLCSIQETGFFNLTHMYVHNITYVCLLPVVDCSTVLCAILECEEGQDLFTPPNECCPVCQGACRVY